MPVYRFSFTDWYATPDGYGGTDWDCDFETVIVDTDDNRIVNLWNSSQLDEERVQTNFPTAIKLGDLSRHRDKLDPRPDRKADHPDVWEKLNSWTPFKDAA